MKSSKPPAFIHVDVDSDRSLGNFYRHRNVRSNSVYERGLPRMMELFTRINVPATFFICGSDVSSTKNRSIIKKLFQRNHEIANHSFSHPNGFRILSSLHQRYEIQHNTEVITSITGQRPVGFRAPGYDVDRGVFRRVQEAGYLYDASLYPSIIHPFLRWFLLLKWNGAVDPGYGSFWNAFAATGIHRRFTEGLHGGALWEVPVSVFPILRLPLHANATIHLPDAYMRWGMSLTRFLRRPFVFLFHAVEFVDQSDHLDKKILVHPSFRLSLTDRLSHFKQALLLLKHHFSVYRTDQYLMEKP